MTDLLLDLRYAVQALRQRPGFLIAAATVLALGIGANTAIFSLVNAFLPQASLVMRSPEQLVGVFSRDTKKPDTYRAFSYPNYDDLRRQNAAFSSLMAHNMALVGITEGQQTRRGFADLVSSNYFETFGVPLFRGRPFSAAEERPSSGIPVAIVSYSFWQRSGADPELLGKAVRVNGRDYQVVGIAPEGFTGTTALVSCEIYLPLGMYEAVINDFEGHGRPLAARDNYALIVVGRLRPGMTQPAAERQLQSVASRLSEAYPAENRDQAFIARPLSRLSVSDAPVNEGGLFATASLLLAASGVILLIASLNVANMMLARASSRRKEIAIRLALGGSRGKIVRRQLFTEGLVLSLLGGALGLLTAWWCTLLLVRSLSRLAPFELVYNAGPDLRVLGATLGFCVASTLLFSLMPAWNLARPNLVSALKSSEREEAAGGRPRRVFSRRNVLVICQVALSLTLLTTAGLFVRSSVSAAQMNPGFRIEGELVLEVDASLAGYDEARGRRLYPALVERLQALPGVESASLGSTIPFGMIRMSRGLHANRDAKPVDASFNVVGPDYFRTLEIPLLRGRAFVPADAHTGAGVSVFSIKPAAARLWPGQDALGRHLQMNEGGSSTGDAKMVDVQVVGVVADTRQRFIGDDIDPHVYVPFGQEYMADTHIHLKAAAAAIPGVRRIIQAEDGQLPVLRLQTLRDHLEGSFDYWLVRSGAQMFGIFGAVALLLATIGLYAVRSYSVAMRTREIGIRMALGARPGEALRMVLREGLLLTGIGLAAGLPLSLGLSKLLAGNLYGLNGAAGAVMALASSLLAMVAAAACYVPARRAAAVDPLEALRYE